jgi:hypothetical protein
MTAVENLLIAQHRHLNTNFLAGLFKTPAFRRSEREAMEFAAHWLEKVNLKEFANRTAGTLGLRSATSSGNRPLHDDAPAHPHARRTGGRPQPDAKPKISKR